MSRTRKKDSVDGKLWLEAKVCCGICGQLVHMTPGIPRIRKIEHFEKELRKDGWRKTRKDGWVCYSHDTPKRKKDDIPF